MQRIFDVITYRVALRACCNFELLEAFTATILSTSRTHGSPPRTLTASTAAQIIRRAEYRAHQRHPGIWKVAVADRDDQTPLVSTSRSDDSTRTHLSALLSLPITDELLSQVVTTDLHAKFGTNQ